MPVERTQGGTSLVDVLDRVLDKGIVIYARVRVFLPSPRPAATPERHHRLHEHAAGGRAREARAEAVKQIVLSLVTNAIKFTPKAP
jgi:signal transduction histidine kinase